MTRLAAFFDMDLTLLAANSANLYARYLWDLGEIGTRDLLRALRWGILYRLALFDYPQVADRLALDLEGMPEQEMADRCEAWFRERVSCWVSPRAAERLEQHRERGEVPVILTASSPYAAGPLARLLEVEDIICTRLEVDRQGRFSGRIERPLCYGEGKVERARAWAREHGVELAGSWFYTDSYSDLPMLEAVGHPVAVNPDRRLRREAVRRGWPVERFGPPPEAPSRWWRRPPLGGR